MIGLLLSVNISTFPQYSFSYAIPYLLLGVLVCIIGSPWIMGKGKRPFPKKRLQLILGIFLLFFGLRWYIFSDTMRYGEIYDDVNTQLSLWENVAAQPYIDFGYMFIMMMAKTLGIDFHLFVFLNSLVDFVLLYYCIRRYSINPPLTCLFFLAFQGILIEANLMRNFKALLIFLLSIRYIEERKLGKYLLCQAAAIPLHMTSVIFIPLYWVLYKRIRFNVVLTISLASVFIYFFASSLLESLTNNLLGSLVGGEGKLALLSMHSSNEQETLLSLGSLERIFFLILTLLLYKRLDDNKQKEIIFSNMFLIYFVLFAIFGFNYVFRDRIPLLFIGSYWFIAPYIVKEFGKKCRYLAIGIIILSFLKIYASTRISSAYYENLFFHSTTVDDRRQLEDMFVVY